MIHVSRRTPPADDAAKARSIIAEGASVIMTGDARQLRRIKKLLDGSGDVNTFLGDHDDQTFLVVDDGREIGSIVMDRVPR